MNGVDASRVAPLFVPDHPDCLIEPHTSHNMALFTTPAFLCLICSGVVGRWPGALLPKRRKTRPRESLSARIGKERRTICMEKRLLNKTSPSGWPSRRTGNIGASSAENCTYPLGWLFVWSTKEQQREKNALCCTAPNKTTLKRASYRKKLHAKLAASKR